MIAWMRSERGRRLLRSNGRPRRDSINPSITIGVIRVTLSSLSMIPRQLANTLNRDLIQPYVDLNFGPQARYPRLELRVPKPEDLKVLADSLEKLVPLGLKVSASVVRDKFGLPDPKEGDELLKSPGLPVSALNREIALNREAPEALDELVDEFTADWQPQVQPVRDVEQVLARMIAEGRSLEEFKQALMGLAGTMMRF